MILDANVIFKTLFDEPGSTAAAALLEEAELWAPDLLLAEIGHAVTRLVRGRVLPVDLARERLLRLSDLPIRWLASESVRMEAFDLSVRLRASYYDCVYLACALAMDDLVVTADESFVRAVRADRDLQGSIRSLGDAM